MKGTELLFLVHHHEPVTKTDLAVMTGDSSRLVSSNLKDAWDDGLLVRRRRPTDNRGTDPYEYAIAPLGEWESVNDEE